MSPAAIVVAVALVAAPGVALAMVAVPSDRPCVAAHLGLVVPLGFGWIGVAALLLALLHVLSLATFLPLYLAGREIGYLAIYPGPEPIELSFEKRHATTVAAGFVASLMAS